MQKKLFIVLVLLLLSGPVWARRFEKLGLLDVDRAVAKQVTQQQMPAWQQKLKQIQTVFVRIHPRPDVQSTFPFRFLSGLNYQEETNYLKRLWQVQKQVNQNPVLAGFTFVAPVPADLANFSADNYALLLSFLKNNPLAKVTRSEPVYPFTLALNLHGQSYSALELWIDVPTKKIYLMSDNFYTTAASKYALQLK